jgi:hypothetical protein
MLQTFLNGLVAVFEWFDRNPTALVPIATLIGALIAGRVVLKAADRTHQFTVERDAIKAATDDRRERERVSREAAAARRAVQRTHLERIVTLALQHAEAEDRLTKSTVMQLAMVATNPNYQPDVKSLLRGEASVQPLDEAMALAQLYFPILTGPLADMRGAASKFSEFREQEVKAWLKDRASWMNTMPSIATRDEFARIAMRVARTNLHAQARAMIESDLLPSEATPCPPAAG